MGKIKYNKTMKTINYIQWSVDTGGIRCGRRSVGVPLPDLEVGDWRPSSHQTLPA
jgi:hypothetical protein